MYSIQSTRMHKVCKNDRALQVVPIPRCECSDVTYVLQDIYVYIDTYISKYRSKFEHWLLINIMTRLLIRLTGRTHLVSAPSY